MSDVGSCRFPSEKGKLNYLCVKKGLLSRLIADPGLEVRHGEAVSITACDKFLLVFHPRESSFTVLALI